MPPSPNSPMPRRSLLMSGITRRLLGAVLLATLLWLAVAWALADAS
jgi:hypothetical protein